MHMMQRALRSAACGMQQRERVRRAPGQHMGEDGLDRADDGPDVMPVPSG